MDYKRKYKMTKEENIEYIKEHLDEFVSASLILEGWDLDLREANIDGEHKEADLGTAANFDDIEADYRFAWELLIDTINQPINSKLMRNLHQDLGKTTVKDAGKLRLQRIERDKYLGVAPVPNPARLDVDLRDMAAIRNTLDRSLYITVYLLRILPFNGANKAMALLVGNRIMIESGQGVISVPQEKASEFQVELKNFYQTADVKMLKDYIYENCITGPAK